MSRTERLLGLLQTLRCHRRPVSGRQLAADLGVSIRTLYRDIATLQSQGAEIEGEPGLGYVLRPGFMLPPLMFSTEEIEALVLGTRWVADRSDPRLGQAARNALAKIATASPEDLRDRISDTALWPVALWGQRKPIPVLGDIRLAMRQEKAVTIDYEDEQGRATSRTIWPVGLAFYEGKQTIAAWCLLRQDFRNFRTDRIVCLTITEERYGKRRSTLEREWRASWERDRRHHDSEANGA